MVPSQGSNGPTARPLTVGEACSLLDSRHGGLLGDETELASRSLAAAPKKLAELASQWAEASLADEPKAGQTQDTCDEEHRLGLCRLAWEEETEKVLYQWLQENPATKERRGPASPVVLCFQSRFPAFAT